MDGKCEIQSENSYVPFLRQLLVASSVFFNVIGKGAVLGFPSILIPRLRDPDSTIKITPEQESWIASIVALSQIIGLFIMMKIMNFLGRRKTHMLSVGTLLFAWIIQILANGFTGILLARILQGLGMGLSGTLAAVILGEMSDPKIRGMFFVVYSMSFTLGVLWVQTLGQFLSWRYTSLATSFLVFTSFVLIYLSPESPDWLISKGRIEECREVFTWLRGSGPEATMQLEKLIEAQMAKAKIANTKEEMMTFTASSIKIAGYAKAIYKREEFYKPIVIMLHLLLMLQAAGTNVLNSYVADIIHDLIGPEADTKLIIVALNIEKVVCYIVALYVIKTFNRRTVLYNFGIACVLIYFAKAGYLFLKYRNALIYDSAWIPTILLFSFMFALTSGLTAIIFTVSGEIFPLEFRGVSSGISALFGSLFFFTSVKSFPILNSSLGLDITYLVYALVMVYCLCVLWYLLPETKDRTLLDIENHFTGARKFNDPKEMMPLKADV